MSKNTEKTYQHDAYGMIGIHQTTMGGKGKVLFGSKIRHNVVYTLRIYPASVDRHLSKDWHHVESHSPLIEIELSPVQLILLLSTMNMGDGIPCTLKSVGGERKPEITLDDIDTEKQMTDNEFQETLNNAAGCIRKLHAQIEQLRKKTRVTKKELEALSGLAFTAQQELRLNIPFIKDRFDEATEKTVGEAAASIDAMFTGIVAKLGIKALHEQYGNELDDPIDVKPALLGGDESV